LVNPDEIVLLKLGGSLITDKNEPLSLRRDILEKAVVQIINSRQKVIIIHGGGSFGHPIAKKYALVNGFNPIIDDQNLGIAKTHDAMVKLNSRIMDLFLTKEHPAIAIQPSSIFIKDGTDIWLRSTEQIEIALDFGISPVLYGDIILDKQHSFSILSGDRIIHALCRRLTKYHVSKVVFTIEKDGIFIVDDSKKDNNHILVEEINHDQIDDLNLANLTEKIDVTGGIKGKLESIKKICALGVSVQIINGLKDQNILKALKNEKVKGTLIKPSEEKQMKDISKRKIEHLKIPLESDVQHRKNYFKYIKFLHHAKPDLDLDEIN